MTRARRPGPLAFLTMLAALLGAGALLDAQEWTRFRGPNGTGRRRYHKALAGLQRKRPENTGIGCESRRAQDSRKRIKRNSIGIDTAHSRASVR